MSKNEIILVAEGISKRFPGVKALDNVHMDLYQGEVLALIGENGAGKSTMMKILLGQYAVDTGTIHYKGKLFSPKSPHDALQNGISMIHQEISLIPGMSVAENIWIGREEKFTKLGIINKKKRIEVTNQLLNRLDIQIAPEAIVSSLSIANMQLVEVARSVSYDSDIIIMDEPTSALTKVEIDKLYKIIRDLSSQGKSVIYISHKLEELFAVCDRVTVFRDGQFVDSKKMKDITQDDLVKLMVGRELTDAYPKEAIKLGDVVLEVKDLSHKGYFEGINFSVRSGEILGFCGLMGSGRTEIMQSIFGIDPITSGSIHLHKQEISTKTVKDAINHRIAMVTEDRLRKGALHKLSVKTNMSLAYLSTITKFGFVNRKKENDDCNKMIHSMAIKTSSSDHEIGKLSGGNQQKVIIGKWLLTEPEVLILDEPTRGIDIGAKSEIYKLIGTLAKQGKAILLISSELPELMGISDRILVIRNGHLAGEMLREDFSQEALMSKAFGISD